jgi:hypothetical protein
MISRIETLVIWFAVGGLLAVVAIYGWALIEIALCLFNGACVR